MPCSPQQNRVRFQCSPVSGSEHLQCSIQVLCTDTAQDSLILLLIFCNIYYKTSQYFTAVHVEILFLNCWTMVPAQPLKVWDASPTLLLEDSVLSDCRKLVSYAIMFRVNHLVYMGIIFYHNFLCVMTNHWILLIFTFKSQLFLCLLNCTLKSFP